MDRRTAGAAPVTRLARSLALFAMLAPLAASAGETLRTRHFEYRVLGFRLVDGLGNHRPAPGHRLAVVEFEARNIDDEPRAVFIGTLRAEHAGGESRFDDPVAVPGVADKLFSELPVGTAETMRFAYEVPAGLTDGKRWSWEPARAGGRRMALDPSAPR